MANDFSTGSLADELTSGQNNKSEIATEHASSRTLRSTLVTILSTMLVCMFIAANVSAAGPVRDAVRFIGFEQTWKMFTNPPHADVSLRAFIRVANEPRKPLAVDSLGTDFRVRRYLASMQLFGTPAEWRCAALFVSAQEFDDDEREVTFAYPNGDGRYRQIFSAHIVPATDSDRATRECGSSASVSSDSSGYKAQP